MDAVQPRVRVERVSRAPKTVPCPKCGKEMIVRHGRFGKFLGCTGYPDCRHIQSLAAPPRSLSITCPDCGQGDVQERRSRRGKTFYGCNRYPDCKFATWDPPILEPCPDCGAKYLVERVTKRSGRTRRSRRTRPLPAPPRCGGRAGSGSTGSRGSTGWPGGSRGRWRARGSAGTCRPRAAATRPPVGAGRPDRRCPTTPGSGRRRAGRPTPTAPSTARSDGPPLGPRLFQVVAGPGRKGRQLDDGAG